MKTTNKANLRESFLLVASWISDGEARPMPKIEFAGRLKKIWGERVFSDKEVAEMRVAELEGEEG